MAFNRLNPGYKQEPPAGRVSDSKTYIGIVKDTSDVQNMGRLRVWIPEIGGDPETPEHWFIVSYASPFAGATNSFKIKKDGKQYGDSQESYGFWFVPPDINNEVLVTFVVGEATRGFYFGCLYPQYMNHMVPGIPSNYSTEPLKGGACGALGAVTEYNKWDSTAQPPDPQRPPYPPLNDGLCREGLFADALRGPSSSGARREAPSKVFGIKTPRGAQFVMDDNEANEFVRIRTRGGTQILVHETNGFVYINSRLGNSWLEVSDQGIDMYSAFNISIRAEKDINLHADGAVNIQGGLGVNLYTPDGQDIKLASGGDTHVVSNNGIFAQAVKGIDIKAGSAIHVQSDSEMDLMGTALHLDASGDLTLKAAGDQYRSGATLFDNTGAIAAAAPATPAKAKILVPQPDNAWSATGACNCGSPATKSSIVSRMPAHEPWTFGHPKNINTPPRTIQPLAVLPALTSGNAGTGANGGPVMKTTPGQGTTPGSTDTTTQTGSGTKPAPADPSTFTTVNVGKFKIPSNVLAAIRQGADITGIRFGYLMAICQVESNFNVNAAPSTSSARGLFQFLTSTWNTVVAQKNGSSQTYGSIYGINPTTVSPDDRLDPLSSAIICGIFTKQNGTYLQKRVGRDPTNTDLYMAHFLGSGGASTFLAADSNAIGAQVSPAAASSNKNVFYDSSGNAKTVGQVYATFQAKVEPLSLSFEQAFAATS